mgnify:FL=1
MLDNNDKKAKKEEKKNNKQDKNQEKKKSKAKLDDKLREAINKYNEAYTMLNENGLSLLTERKRVVDLLGHIENLVNSLANRPKEYDKSLEEVKINKHSFKDVYEHAASDLNDIKGAAVGMGSGVLGGAAVASLAPSAAMWIATTFGTASTGTAISALSGAAATNAALAWLGGGTLAAGGGGTAAGAAFLAFAGPIGWGIAGATILTSVALFARKAFKRNKEKEEEILTVLKNTEKLSECSAKIKVMLSEIDYLRKSVSSEYEKCLKYYNKNFSGIDGDGRFALGTLVNNTKSLSAKLRTSIGNK